MKHFFQHIRLKYGEDTCYIIKQHNKNHKKLAKQQQRLKFLLQCKDFGIIPPHLKGKTMKIKHGFQLDITKKELAKIEEEFTMKILNLEIKEANIQIKIVRTNIEHIKKDLREKLQDIDFKMVAENQKQFLKDIASSTEKGLKDKLQKQIDRNFERFGFIINEDWFINKTKIHIPRESRWILSLGKKFALPVTRKTFSPVHLIAEVEQGIQTLEDEREKR